MAILNQWIDDKLAVIASNLPTLIHQDAASFASGYNTGYKSALLDLEKKLDNILEGSDGYPPSLPQIYKSTSEFGDLF
jgi:hypothetical protein